MDKGNATAFGTVNLKAQTLSDPSRPGGGSGQPAVGTKDSTPLTVGSSRPGGNLGQKNVPSGGAPVTVGNVRPGGSAGQGTGAKGPKPKPYRMID